MISRVPPCLDTSQTYSVPEVVNAEAASVIHASSSSSSEITQHANSLLYSLSFLKDKVRQVESLVGILVAPEQAQPESTSIAVASLSTMVQEVIMTASSMMFTCQQMVNNLNNNHSDSTNAARADWKVVQDGLGHERGVQSLFTEQTFDWYADDNNTDYNCENLGPQITVDKRVDRKKKLSKGVKSFSEGFDIIEIEAEDLLAKYTHYCQVCGKGFKRDANLRMHMRAHGDEYKTNAALSNPMKNVADEKDSLVLPRKYSCPHEGCRWNKKHAKFQPLKSMVCVKNHYKRSHCPKMYVCKRCNRKQFSVLSDLRTHEKHCGDLKWQCSCGTTFSRKDKLMGHVALFVGHSPVATESPKPAKAEKNQSIKMHIDDR